MNGGRPKEEPPEGHKTVSEVAAILGISTSAVRQQIQSGRLPFLPDEEGDPIRIQSGERRYYIPEEAVRTELERRKRTATGGDVEKVERVVQRRTTEIIESQFREIMEHEERVVARIEAVRGELETQGSARAEQFERVLVSVKRLEGKLEDIAEILKHQHKPPRRGWRNWFSGE